MIISASVEAERMMESERVRRSSQLFFCKVFMSSQIDREKKIIAFDTKYGWQGFLWGFFVVFKLEANNENNLLFKRQAGNCT